MHLYYENGWDDYYRDSTQVLMTPLTMATCFCTTGLMGKFAHATGGRNLRHEKRSIVYQDKQVEGCSYA